jgi:adenylosuccinate synthase
MTSTREAFLVIDLGYGDQGKGSVTDFLVRDRGAHTVVRYNGGAQAGHNVVTPDGRHHTFAQFGAGSFVPGVRTFLSRYMAVQPWAMLVEADHLARAGVTDAFERTDLDADAPVITPFHRAVNRLRERARGDGRHGSCGVGVGETVSDARSLDADLVVRARDLSDARALRVKLARVQERKRADVRDLLRDLRGDAAAHDDIEHLEDAHIVDVYVQFLAPFRARARVVGGEALSEALKRPGAVVFEGAQGVLLDEWRGFHPYTTWSTCTPDNALALLAEGVYAGEVTRLGVVRAYATRHGAGPFVTEDRELGARVPDRHNRLDPWQGGFRVGWFDAVATRYAIRVCGGVDALALTCLDRLRDEPAWRLANAYVIDGARVRDIEPGPLGDLDHQAALTERISRAKAEYATTTERGDVRAHAEAIAAETARVRLISSGPTADDKRWIE